MDLRQPFHHKVRHHVIRTAGVCDEWCREARMYDRILPTAFLGGVLLFLIYLVTVAAPINFASASLVKISQGMSVAQAAQVLKEKHIINSVIAFEVANALQPGGGKIVAGEYFFPGPQNVITIARRLATGDHELIPVKVRVPEGATAKEIAELLAEEIIDFDSEEFYRLALPKEGRLFPDTYFFMPGEEASLVLSAMLSNFEQHMADKKVAEAIAAFGKPLEEVLVMASILEKEAGTTKDRRLVSGVLWKRISLGMKLQVDAVFPYIIGVNTFELTKEQLQTDSPYNTYLYKGLPPGPIANPSLDSILAAVTPTKSNYLFYLSDYNSKMYYCANYACHQANARKYLGN